MISDDMICFWDHPRVLLLSHRDATKPFHSSLKVWVCLTDMKLSSKIALNNVLLKTDLLDWPDFTSGNNHDKLKQQNGRWSIEIVFRSDQKDLLK